jgi:hypothetical protein
VKFLLLVQGSSKGSILDASLRRFSRLLHRLKFHGSKEDLIDFVGVEMYFGHLFILPSHCH